MAYKTVLVHCNDKRRIARVGEAAATIAKRFQAHLIGVSVTPPVAVIPSGMPGTPDAIVLDEHCMAYRNNNPALRAAFEAAAGGSGAGIEWREADAGNANFGDVVLQQARAADLIVAAQTEVGWQGSAYLDVADRLAVESGRPVLIVPNEGLHEAYGRNVLVAWNARREAARAVFDALPLLERARQVKVVWVNPQEEGGPSTDVPAADICAALARHGVRCEATEAVRPHAEVGETLLMRAAEYGADLLVMGCYGHSRLREFVLGGASRHVLQHMRMPVLMSH